MLVNYYEIAGCMPEKLNGVPVLIAPMGTPPDLLAKYRFLPEKDGRYAHILDVTEYRYITSYEPDTPVVTFTDPGAEHPDQTDPTAKKLHFAAVLLLLLSFALMALNIVLDGFAGNATVAKVLMMLSSLSGMAGWVLIITLRVKYPNNKAGRRLFTVWVILSLISLFVTVWIVAVCATVCHDVLSGCSGCTAQ